MRRFLPLALLIPVLAFAGWNLGEEIDPALSIDITEDGFAKAERVAVLRDRRTSGVGRALMEALEAEAARLGHDSVKLGAQVSALGFYEKLGYTVYGPEFDDAGIPHRMMKKPLP